MSSPPKSDFNIPDHLLRYVPELVRIAKKKSTCKQRHAALIVGPNGVVEARGYNYWLRVTPSRTTTVHAEECAIAYALKKGVDLRKCYILVLRVTPGDNIGTSKPCDRSCSKLIAASGLRGCYHT